MTSDIATILAGHEPNRTGLIDILWDVQRESGYISREAAAGIAEPKQPETEHPGKDAHQNDSLDAEPPQKEWDRQNEQRLRDLGKRDQKNGMPYPKRFGKSRHPGEVADESAGKGITDL